MYFSSGVHVWSLLRQTKLLLFSFFVCVCGVCILSMYLVERSVSVVCFYFLSMCCCLCCAPVFWFASDRCSSAVSGVSLRWWEPGIHPYSRLVQCLWFDAFRSSGT